jgi:cytochrome c-type biogenesis protein CcmH/NrfF
MTVQHNGAHVSAHVSAHVQVLAHHALLLAIPAFFPAVAVVGVVIWVAVRDRRTHDSDERLREEQKTNANTAERNGDPE